ncbi:MAG: hypothetical protein FWE36_08305 [Erysipelotrichales bacterium]|nr:hypothetical protein [Erysipelotrichales bacterium]
MDKKDNNVRVCTFGVITGIILLLLGCIVFAVPWLAGGTSNETFTIGVFIVLLCYFLFSLVLFIYLFITMWPILKIDEKGIHKSLLGIFFKKTFLLHRKVHFQNSAHLKRKNLS